MISRKRSRTMKPNVQPWCLSSGTARAATAESQHWHNNECWNGVANLQKGASVSEKAITRGHGTCRPRQGGQATPPLTDTSVPSDGREVLMPSTPRGAEPTGGSTPIAPPAVQDVPATPGLLVYPRYSRCLRKNGLQGTSHLTLPTSQVPSSTSGPLSAKGEFLILKASGPKF